MKKYYFSVALIVFLVVISTCFLKTNNKNHIEKKWNTFADVPGGWEIKYPTDVTSIELMDDLGPKDWLSNVMFRNNEHWIFSVWTGATTTSPTHGFISIHNDNPNEKSFISVKENKAFYIHFHPDAPIEKILESLVVEE